MDYKVKHDYWTWISLIAGALCFGFAVENARYCAVRDTCSKVEEAAVDLHNLSVEIEESCSKEK